MRVGRDVSDHKTVVIYLDWSHTNYGKGVFRCGANTHKDAISQKRITLALNKALCDFVDKNTIADSLRQIIGQIKDTEYKREEFLSIDNSHYKFPSLQDEHLSSIDSQLQQLYFLLRTNNEIFSTLMSKN